MDLSQIFFVVVVVFMNEQKWYFQSISMIIDGYILLIVNSEYLIENLNLIQHNHYLKAKEKNVCWCRNNNNNDDDGGDL